MFPFNFSWNLLLIVLICLEAVCNGQNAPCPFCEKGSTLLNPEAIVSIPPGYVDIDQASCFQIQTVSMSGMLDATTCSILNSGYFKDACLCSEVPTTSGPTIAPSGVPVVLPSTQAPISYPTRAPQVYTNIPTPIAPVAYQTLAPRLPAYQTPTVTNPTWRPRSYVYQAPTAPKPLAYQTLAPISDISQESKSGNPGTDQTLTPRSPLYPAPAVPTPVTYQTLAPKTPSQKPLSSTVQSESLPAVPPNATGIPTNPPVATRSPTDAPVSTRHPTTVVDFDYSSCSICGAGQRVVNRTKVIKSPPDYFIGGATCYQIERLGLIGIMDTISCRLAALLIGEPECGCIAKELSSTKPVPLPVNASVCHVCGKGYVVGSPSSKVQAPVGFFVGSASCGQVAEIGMIGLIPKGQCTLTKQVVKSNCQCVRTTNYPTGPPSDYPSAVPSDIPSQSPFENRKKRKSNDEDDDEP